MVLVLNSPRAIASVVDGEPARWKTKFYEILQEKRRHSMTNLHVFIQNSILTISTEHVEAIHSYIVAYSYFKVTEHIQEPSTNLNTNFRTVSIFHWHRHLDTTDRYGKRVKTSYKQTLCKYCSIQVRTTPSQKRCNGPRKVKTD